MGGQSGICCQREGFVDLVLNRVAKESQIGSGMSLQYAYAKYIKYSPICTLWRFAPFAG